MPTIDGVGCSGYSPLKQAAFGAFLAAHLAKCRHVARNQRMLDEDGRPAWTYFYLDLLAGPGYLPNRRDCDGSPVVALRLLHAAGVPYRAFLFEENPANVDRLRARLDVLGLSDPGTVTVIGGRFQDHFPAVLAEIRACGRFAFGLAYADPNAITPKDTSVVDAFETIARHPGGRYVDLLLHTQGTAYKRITGAGLNGMRGFDKYRDAPPLASLLGRVGKRTVCIKCPTEQEQWTFLFFTGLKDYRFILKLGFHPIDSPWGERFLDQLSMYGAEFEAKRRKEWLF